jgi:hypothetical protein
MSRSCPKCRRPNPSEAIYCYHDGVVLEGRAGGDIPADGSAMNIGARPFTVPFLLPLGQACTNFVQLALAFLKHPDVMGDLLCQGKVEMFLAGQGRADLAMAAHAARSAPNRERGLDEFLSKLPVPLGAARLHTRPEVLELGTVQVGEDREATLTLENRGTRLLYGAAGSPAPWLALGDLPALQSKNFQFMARYALKVRVLGKELGAYDKPRQGEIQLETNGGTITVLVRLQVPVRPFTEGVLAGAQSPRQAAHKAKAAPKEAATLIESGALLRWYQSNGWVYPVRGPAATGVAALQQYFEALGLVKPPQVELSEDLITLRGWPGEKIEHILAVITQENRNVVAHGVADEPWLEVGRPVFRGRSAFLPLTVRAVPGAPGQSFGTRITVTANGGRQLRAQVTLEVRAATPSVVSGPLPRPVVPPKSNTGYRQIRLLLFLIAGLGLAILSFVAVGYLLRAYGLLWK